MTTLNQILLDSAATLDLSAALPTGDELTLRSNYANQALNDAAATGMFPEFDTEFSMYATFASSGLSVQIPGFRELKINPRALSSGGWIEFPEILNEDKYDSTGNYCYVTGNPQSGYSFTFNGLTAGMSLSVIYQRYPSGMPSLSSICELSDATYVTRKIESYVLYSRGDDRFQTAEARANNALLNMTGRKMKSPGGQSTNTKIGFNNPLG